MACAMEPSETGGSNARARTRNVDGAQDEDPRPREIGEKQDAQISYTRLDHFFTPAVVSPISLSFLLGMSEFIIVGILPDISQDLHVPLTQIGGLVSLFAFTYAPATPIGASISSRFERFHTLFFLTVVFLVGNILCALARSYPMLVIARIVIAVISGTMVAVSMTFADDVTSQTNRTKFVS